MANLEHLALLPQGAYFWNQWRKQHPHIIPDFSRADLGGANLIGANLSGALQLHLVIMILCSFYLID